MRNVIKDTFVSIMNRNGFHKKSDTWYRRTDDAILVVNLQKSDYGYQYYINLAVWLKALGENAFPKEHHCHIRLRAVHLDRNHQRHWEHEVLNLENTSMSDVERAQQIQTLLEDIAIPFLLSCGSLDRIRKLYREGQFKGAAVRVQAQEFLGKND